MASNRPFGQARCAARCPASGKHRNAPDGRFHATEGRVLLPECGVALCLKCGHYGAKRALPSGKIIPVKWVPIVVGWHGQSPATAATNKP